MALIMKEFAILHLLASYPGSVFTKLQIYQRVWKKNFNYITTSVSNHISSLWQKLGLKAKDGQYIQTTFGLGYHFALDRYLLKELQRFAVYTNLRSFFVMNACWITGGHTITRVLFQYDQSVKPSTLIQPKQVTIPCVKLFDFVMGS